MQITSSSRIVIQFIDSETGKRSEMVSPTVASLLFAIKANSQHIQDPESPPNPLVLILGGLDNLEDKNVNMYPLVHTHTFFKTHSHLMEQHS